ncbi:MAG: hypothetical protein II350_03155, partial [Clostridia bacterium]|nr:hypothetical protein [Clostridia bacterium]
VLGILSVAGCSSANLLFPIAGIVLASMASKGGETKFSKIGKITSIIGLVCNILCIIGWVMLMASGLFSEIF